MTLNRHILSVALVGVLSAIPAFASAATTEIVIQYPYGELFDETHKQIAAEFAKLNPDIKVSFRAPYESYEEGTQKVLREAITRQMPDITFQGLNRVRILVDRKIAVPLDGFIKAEKNFAVQGFHQAMYDIGTQSGKVYALPFAISLPIAYYNLDLVKRAGGDPDKLPTTWDGVIGLANKVRGLGADINGVTMAWDITGNWLWQAPVLSQGGSMLTADEKKVAFNGAPGEFAIDLYARLVQDAKLPNISQPDSRAAFAAGKTGIHVTSTSDLAKVTSMVGGKFAPKTHAFPSVKEGDGRLPAGGNPGVILSQDAKKRQAAWEVLKFWTRPIGASIVARTTGYMPPNKVANEIYLKDFYVQNPNNFTAVKQLPLLTRWYAFPGENGLKITDVIKDHLQTIVSGKRAAEPRAVLKDMANDVQQLLPR